MANSLCKSSVQKTYQDVINDVISNIRDHFLEDGVDEQVLQELKQLWENKLKATKAVEDAKEMEKMQQHQNKLKQDQIDFQKVQNQMRQVVGQVAPNNHVAMMSGDYRRVPIQLTIPQLPGSQEGQRTLAIEVPEVFLQGNHLKNILTSNVVSTTMGLSVYNACAYLQDHVNKAFVKHQHMMAMMPPHLMNSVQQDSQYMPHMMKDITQCDGNEDSSEDEDLDEDNDEDPQEDVEDEEASNRLEEEPLNSGDDVSDADEAHSSFETENVIVCQYDKITRSRNRWKFHFKDGIMNLEGEDYVFQKANGDAEW
ncbi:unnamed protein product [Brassicogethes aeneus]|uniref:Uncharacterized protein n=1 Tax=Brassicogethes aeneus TaxID=1431903 RepID=A0A9P0BID2_BRAAE|nr:unnamed protein product [Brassicogethes aeneus]